ncbi:hypothetical protein [Aquimarina longa]|uniref:hypothetical protein n=1 Tax=Aquimarina longa TaxID=1080221 RepID=UPI000781D39D|nr:hypothetical protein [Aquimarina longa]
MNVAVLTFVGSIAIPLIVFTFLRKYVDRNNSVWTIIGGGVIALIGIYIYIYSVEEKKYFYLSLIIPLYAALLYKILSYLFLKKFGRLPIDTFFDYNGTIWDRLFNIIYGILITVFPIYILYFISKLYN